MEGREDFFVIQAVAAGYLQRFRALDFRITSELQQETDTLIQRVTNLITIDEGYRSRDQNASIWRLTWITVSTKPPPGPIPTECAFKLDYIPPSGIYCCK